MNPLLHTRDEGTVKWTSPEGLALKKAKTVKSAEKVATVFWDARGIIHIDYLLSKQTINSDSYASYWTVSTTF